MISFCFNVNIFLKNDFYILFHIFLPSSSFSLFCKSTLEEIYRIRAFIKSRNRVFNLTITIINNILNIIKPKNSQLLLIP